MDVPKVKSYKKSWDAEHTEKIKDYKKSWDAEHTQNIKDYKTEHAEKIKVYKKSWDEENAQKKKNVNKTEYMERKSKLSDSQSQSIKIIILFAIL